MNRLKKYKNIVYDIFFSPEENDVKRQTFTLVSSVKKYPREWYAEKYGFITFVLDSLENTNMSKISINKTCVVCPK